MQGHLWLDAWGRSEGQEWQYLSRLQTMRWIKMYPVAMKLTFLLAFIMGAMSCFACSSWGVFDQDKGVQEYPFTVKPYSELVKQLEYDRNAPLNAKLAPLLARDGIRVSDLAFDDVLGGDPISAYLVEPIQKGPH